MGHSDNIELSNSMNIFKAGDDVAALDNSYENNCFCNAMENSIQAKHLLK